MLYSEIEISCFLFAVLNYFSKPGFGLQSYRTRIWSPRPCGAGVNGWVSGECWVPHVARDRGGPAQSGRPSSLCGDASPQSLLP